METTLQHKTSPCIYGVSLGPGDPSLITVKGLEILKQVDVIYYPGALFADGTQASYSASILQQYDLDQEKCRGYYLKMSNDRAAAEATYSIVFEQILKDYTKGKRIAIVCEGDISTYSSFSYLLRRIQQQCLRVELIPGISSFHLAAAVQQIPLCLQKDRVLILPRVRTKQQFVEALDATDGLVLMKIKSSIQLIYEVMRTQTTARLFYFERLGTPMQYSSSDWTAILKRDIPYFSLIIILK